MMIQSYKRKFKLTSEYSLYIQYSLLILYIRIYFLDIILFIYIILAFIDKKRKNIFDSMAY
ncbi:hypothetical protein Emtol_0636 [Emticicia oligotrophica DSM 17448]|uniref:Uncharacterized protein n=1 Tax=Emticicia oligotrophica (strain DSM 17448 / CIP 109782 / MTCC 6937 / GPTSA100-15) TaxID=929562 RepID=A0ABM5MXG7_EMTOG|nr:hypothetical protein Emtol_0636 [Emticicia oligotrophica DSM 17448]